MYRATSRRGNDTLRKQPILDLGKLHRCGAFRVVESPHNAMMLGSMFFDLNRKRDSGV
jgi:hypothetical protein